MQLRKEEMKKIEEFDNIHSMNRVTISNKSIFVNETEFDKKPHDDDKDKKPHDDDKAQTYFRSSSSGYDFWFLLKLLFFVTFFQY